MPVLRLCLLLVTIATAVSVYAEDAAPPLEMPPVDRYWTAADYKTCWQVVRKDPSRLPIAGSERTGETYKRMLDFRNITEIEKSTTEPALLALRLATIQEQLMIAMAVYAQHPMDLKGEFVDVIAFGTKLAARTCALSNIGIAQLAKDNPDSKVDMTAPPMPNLMELPLLILLNRTKFPADRFDPLMVATQYSLIQIRPYMLEADRKSALLSLTKLQPDLDPTNARICAEMITLLEPLPAATE